MEAIAVNNRITETTCPYCGVGCGVAVHNEGTGVAGMPEHPANQGRLCVKGAALHETLDHGDRLLYPEVDGHECDWDTALTRITQRLRATLDEYGPDSVALYGSGQLLTEDYYAANKLMKGFIGSNHMDTNSRLCMASPVAAHKRAFGSDTVPGCYEDLEETDLLVLVGSNAAWTHPVLYQRMAAARAARPEMKVVVIDPRRTATCDLADLHLAPRPGSDAFLFNGLLAWLDACDALDRDYIEEHTRDFPAALEQARRQAGSTGKVAATCDLDAGCVRTFFEWFGARSRTVTFYSQGINQTATGTDKCNAIINCHLATGRVGRPGASPLAITGQPNAMGGREVGGLANTLAAHMDYTPDNIDRVRRFWRAPRMAEGPGLKAVDLFEGIARGRIRFVWILSTNPLVSLPDADRMRAALRQCPTVVVSECMANTDTVREADIKLPACTWGENNGTVTNSERCVSRQRPFLTPAGEARPDWWALAQVGRRLGHAEAFGWTHPGEIFAEHAALSGFENDGTRAFDIRALAGLDRCGYDALEPVRWPVNEHWPSGRKRLFGDGIFTTGDGRARFVPVTAALPDARRQAGELVMNTGRVRDQWHTMTRTGKARRLLQHIGEPFAELHPDDAGERDVNEGDLVRVSNDQGQLILRARLGTGQRRGEIFVPMHWNSAFSAAARMGTLVQAITDPVSGQPESKYSRVDLHPCRPAWQGFLLTRDYRHSPACLYWSYSPVPGGHYFELAGDEGPEQARDRLRALLRPDTAGEPEWLQLADPGLGHFREALIHTGRLEAVFFLHPRGELPDREWLIGLLGQAEIDDADRQVLLRGLPPDGRALGPMVCSCYQVDAGRIRDAIAAGADSVAALGETLQCGTNCGSCIPELKTILAREAGS